MKRTYTFSVSVTRPDSSVREWAKSLPARDVALLAGALALFLLEPVVLYWVFERADWRPPQGEPRIVLRSEPSAAPGPAVLGSNEEVITPLNARDPSSLILASPGRPTGY